MLKKGAQMFFTAWIAWLPFLLYGQTFPVTSSVSLNSPSLPYLEDFLMENPVSISATFILNDPREQSFDIGIRMTISGEGISIVTSPDYLGDIYTLEYNVPLTLTGADLSDCLLYTSPSPRD